MSAPDLAALQAANAELRGLLSDLTADHDDLLAVVSADDSLLAAVNEMRHYRDLVDLLKSQLDACMEEKNALIRQVTALKKREANR